MKKIRLFKDQEDFVKVLTNDPITNIIGVKGSGKTTSTLSYLSDDDTIVVNCDRLLELPSGEEEDRELSPIRNLLKKKYTTIPEGEMFIDCYYDIVKYIMDKKKKGLIEGNIIQDVELSLLKGKIVVKRTGVLKSYIRAVIRDYQNPYFLNLEKKQHKYFYRITRFYKIAKRRFSVFHQAKEINEAMEILDAK